MGESNFDVLITWSLLTWNLCKVKVKLCDWPTCRNILHGNKDVLQVGFLLNQKNKKAKLENTLGCGAPSLQIFIFCMTYFYREVKKC